jgi:tetratricopeptide (TPR) repeat protein
MEDLATERQPLSGKEKRELDIEIEFLSGLIERDPEYVEALQLLGDDFTKRGQFNDGLKIDEHLSRLLPDDSMVFYNLACSYSLTDRIDDSITALNKAVHLGYDDSKWMDTDPDLNKVRTDPRYQSIRHQLTKKHTA